MALSQRRILKNYRNLPPTRFHGFNRKVSKGLTDNPLIPVETWGANPDLIAAYLAASEKHDAVYHEAIYGSILVIAQREALQEQIVTFLDEIASLLEAAAVRNPEVLLSSGFDLAKERRSSTRGRVKPALIADEASVEQTGSHP
jgi:hypothetical protein